jgi:predicted nucleotidyltransferase
LLSAVLCFLASAAESAGPGTGSSLPGGGPRAGSPSRIVQSILRLMQRSLPPPLLPLLLLWSRLQAEIPTLVLLRPGQEWSLTGLAARTGASVSSVQREITRAEQAGVVQSRRLGSTRLVKAADSPLTARLTELLLRSFGPRQVLAEELGGVAGIERAYLFGSWAARYAGEPGRAPADLDVLVIGAPDRDELDDAAQRAAGRLAQEVSVTIRSAAWWREGTDGFHTDVTRRPLVPLFSGEGAG